MLELAVMSAQYEASLSPAVLTQPKAQIGEQLRDSGLLVPKIYSSADEIPPGTDAIFRGEHPSEQDGLSGLGSSYVLRAGHDPRTLPTKYTNNAPLLARYLDSAGLDEDSFLAKASFSIWEYIPGTNITVVADDVLEGFYHVFGREDKTEGVVTEGSIVNKDGIALKTTKKLGELGCINPDAMKKVLSMYERIRQIGIVAADNCPTMEMQLGYDGQLYGLQVQEGRTLTPVETVLRHKDFDPREGWFHASGVRGAVDHSLQRVVLHYADGAAPEQAKPEDGYYGPSVASLAINGIHERMAPARTVDITPIDFDQLQAGIASDHGQRSRWFKPQASLAIEPIPGNELIPQSLLVNAAYYSAAEEANIGLEELEIVSDGNNGYARIRPGAQLTII